MQVKIDTKEKFTVVTPIIAEDTDNIAADWVQICKDQLLKEVKNVVLNLEKAPIVEVELAKQLVSIQQLFYESNASFVICGLQPVTEQFLDNAGILEMLNVTPSESEAWDIVQMEEIERELLDSDDMEFDTHDQ
jgi:anti-anti-sigma regulatory factor